MRQDGSMRGAPEAQTAIDEYSLRLRGIRFHAHLGVSRTERATQQEVIVDVDLTLPVSALPEHDEKRDVVNYDAVARTVVDEGLARPHRLLETYVGRVVERLFEETPATKVRVAATKRRVPTKYPVDAAIVELVANRRVP
jgi:dihydroneopterin aldolase